MILNLTTIAIVAAFALRSPFDERHQRRLFVLSSDNVSSLRDVRQLFELMVSTRGQITSHERYLHVGAADGAPGFDQLVNDIAGNFGVVGTQAVLEDMHDWNGDWDILYPFSAVGDTRLGGCYSLY